MRLICPNCGAQYEVDDSVIPKGGRDVQCSNCGHTWFQRPAGHDRDQTEEEPADVPEVQVAADKEPAQEDIAESANSISDHLPEDEGAKAVAEEDADHLPEEEFSDEIGVDGIEERQLKPRELDPGVTDILREEAAREAAERAEEGGGLETQPDLGLENGEDGDEARERMARLQDQPEDDADAADGEEEAEVAAMVAASNRRDLLPDIEEINSTLTASSDRDEEDDEEREEKRARSGFRRGFILAVLFFVLLALLYTYAPRIIDSYPAAEPALSAYVDAINGLRRWVDGVMQSAVEKLTVLLGQLGGEGG